MRAKQEKTNAPRIDFMETALDALPIGIAINTIHDGKAVYVNRAFEEIYGWKREQLNGVDAFFECVYPDPEERERVRMRVLEDITSGNPQRMHWKNVTITTGKGEKRIVTAKNIPLLERNLMISTVQDVSQMRAAEEDLRLTQTRLAALLNQLPNVVLYETGGGREFISENVVQMLGYPPSKFEESRNFFPTLIHPDDQPKLAEQVKDWHEKGEPGELKLEFRVTRADGKVIWVEDRMVSLQTQDGKPYMSGVMTDVSDRMRAEEDRRELEEHLQQFQKLESLGVLAGGIAHEFNNLLVSILGNADLSLLEMPEDSPHRTAIEGIYQASLRASDLTNQMLAYSGRGNFVVEPLDLNLLIRNMENLLKTTLSKSATLVCALTEPLPIVEADASQMQQVVLNLVSNASDALDGKPGDVTISTGLVVADQICLREAYIAEHLPVGEYVFIEVADTGVGMDPATRARIFDPFFTTKFTGRGLGLAAVLGIIRGHKGAIHLTSRPGKGSAFRILLTRSDRETTPSQARNHASEKPTEGGLVLIIDDEPGVRQTTQMALQHFGYQALTAEDGEVGVKLFREHTEDIILVLLDLTMPKLSGENTFAELVKIREDVRVVLISGYSESEAASKFTGKGLAGFLQKPYRMKELETKLNEVLQK